MRNWQFSYTMKTVFIEEIIDHSFTLKCVPKSSGYQLVENVDIEMSPAWPLSFGTDAFGNIKVYSRVVAPHDLFVVRVHGSAQVSGYPYEEEAGSAQWIYKYATKYTKMGSRLQALYNLAVTHINEKQTAYQTALIFMKDVYDSMQYVPAVTGIGTTAEEALTLGKGVCQDYTHIFIALCRQHQIPARYVVGMMPGEGASHAWAEVYCEGYWYGLDPTNQRPVDDSYIKISHGRDYQDCLVERGIFKGNGNQQKVVGVKVFEVKDE